MRIKFQPKNPKAYAGGRFVNTNLGEFRLGDEPRLLTQDEEKYGKQLVANGDFVDVDADDSSAAAVPQPEAAIAPEKKKSKTGM